MVDKWMVETALSPEWNFYTRANVGEVFPTRSRRCRSPTSRTNGTSVVPRWASARRTTASGSWTPTSFPTDEASSSV